MRLKDPKRSLIYVLTEELKETLKRLLLSLFLLQALFCSERIIYLSKLISFCFLWLLQFKKRIKSIAVDGSDILTAAMEAAKKASARLEAKEAAAKAKAKKEEERIAELKKVRGEKWLPSIAREMKKEMKVNYTTIWFGFSYLCFILVLVVNTST